ncbi:DUF1330 domain-containing protein [Planktotalea sp.]|uniref:DUF1330 domain-containing protein n=1 Tax=Planktotalea sp. TaxID=2029877 RepID=UPI003D6A9006
MDKFIDPNRAQFEAFKGLDRDKPIEMLNLVRLRDVAAYPEDHPLAGEDLSGADAYANYGRATGPIFQRVGGTILWRGTFETTLIGPEDEAWHVMFIAHYPTAHAFLEMATDPDYQREVVHRQAAVETSRLIRCDTAQEGSVFG